MYTYIVARLDVCVCVCLGAGLGGTIYIGIDPLQRLVRGVRVDHNQRDEFRIGVSSALHRMIAPKPRGSDVSVKFLPVAKREGCDDPDRRRYMADIYVIGQWFTRTQLCRLFVV